MPISSLVSSLIFLHCTSNQHIPRSAHKAHTRNPCSIYCTVQCTYMYRPNVQSYRIYSRQLKILTKPTVVIILLWLATYSLELGPSNPLTPWRVCSPSSPPPEPKGEGTHSLRVRGVGPNPDDRRKSLVLCLLCDFKPWLSISKSDYE
jgi:hypothetical protein